ncbi:uncharacterized protein LOC122645427 [Telopea speciosissima]|uniref:uncharacterized protein LOC122645427 n=1 Tax=Telopea speciosissima TaxID=54955 RepID=UPI001CC57FEF|nr:uncharacterized protein LOC122645427 [Telopea speciosissima]
MGRSSCPKLVFLKKTRKFKKLKLLKYYNYAYIEEYQFSPSNTPLVHYYKKPFKKRGRSRVIQSLFILCSCLGGMRVDEEYEETNFALEAPPVIVDGTAKELPEPLDSDDEDDFVD